MDEPTTLCQVQDRPSAPEAKLRLNAVPAAVRWREWGLLLLLLLAASGIRAWVIPHTEVAARDSIGFIRYALHLEQEPWPKVISDSQQHPGYPLLLMVVSWPVRYFCGATDSYSMQLSAQLASGLAGVLLVIPMFYLGKELFDRRVGFWGALLFQCLPVTARILSDALSEALYLFFVTVALLLAVRAFRSRSVWRFVFCGVLTGLAYWTRPEGALLVPAVGLVVLAVACVPSWRWPWKRLLNCGGAFGLTALVVGSPFVLITGRLTVKPNPDIIKDDLLKSITLNSESISQPVRGSLWAVYAPENLKDRRWWGLQAVAEETVRGYQYVVWVPVLLGLWWFRQRLAAQPGAWVLIALCVLHALILWRLAMILGYVSDRHVQVLVLCGIFSGAAAVLTAGPRLMVQAGRVWQARKGREARFALDGRWLSIVLLVVLTTFALPTLSKPLHFNRAGHRAAGLWLARHCDLSDEIIDPFCWAHYYAGRVFCEGQEITVPTGHTRLQYAVLDRPDKEHPHLPLMQKAEEVASRGRLVYYWPENLPLKDAKIRIFAAVPK
jgi:hypothetical protein